MPANQLINQTSPYLLQHAYNPVNWQPWGAEALQTAKSENKPIILSIGYSACHWCHVMEHESFENEAIAQIMNEHYVCIKVDREERPDIDAIYLDAVQAMGIHGGWPLHVFLLPNLKPFYGGTYFRPNQWAQICQSIATAYKQQYSELENSADGFANSLNANELGKYLGNENNKEISYQNIKYATESILAQVDYQWGGTQKAPKFVMPVIWEYLLAVGQLAEPQLLTQIDQAINTTLNKIAQGGIYDHVAGGFARYSVDAQWFCPHFEKMLYDNAQLIGLYAIAYHRYKKPLYKEIVNKTIAWLQAELQSDGNGLFYSALDADSEGVEGKYYTWQKAEIEQLLAEKSGKFCEKYQISEHGNWEEEAVNILWKTDDFLDETFAEELNILANYRKSRIPPGLDNKIICSWNALAISGLAKAAIYLEAELYLIMAQQAAHALLQSNYQNGQLYRITDVKGNKIAAFLEDYATLIQSLIHLYTADYDENWLVWAQTLCHEATQKLYDPNDGFFFFAAKNDELIAQKKEYFDNVIPASNSIMAHCLWDLSVYLSNDDFGQISKNMCEKIQKITNVSASYLSNWHSLLVKIFADKIELVCTGQQALLHAKQLRLAVDKPVYLLAATSSSVLPLLANRIGQQNQIFVCCNNSCQLPVTSPSHALELLAELTQK
jgi:uncharacterized protein